MTGRARDLDDLRGEIQELFADLWQVPRFSGMHRRHRPQCDCFQIDHPPELHVVVELPGVDPGSVHISAARGTLVVSGRRERPRVDGARYRHMEIEYGEFERRLELTESVNADGASATYERGLLRIVLPLEEP
ncbi:MAG: Hsp20/alpha crystallin family protein [Acidobacteriota bacterium]|nr:Hsp20/alpha crystallin family protein [Acidobacteriota bacterium]